MDRRALTLVLLILPLKLTAQEPALDTASVVALAFQEAWRTNDPERLAALFASNAVYVSVPTGRLYTGPAGAIEVLRSTFTGAPDTQIDFRVVSRHGNNVVLGWVRSGTHTGDGWGVPPTGRRITIEGTSTLEVRDGLIQQVREDWDLQAFMAQLGFGQRDAIENARADPEHTFDETVPSGATFQDAEFRMWIPVSDRPLRATVVLLSGSNGDGRPLVELDRWRSLAEEHGLALLGCRFTDWPHEQMFLEQYVDVPRGSGQALLDALASLAEASGNSDLSEAPLFLWGMSAGGEFAYEFVAWKPERVAAFVVNKGGIYYSGLLPPESRAVPGLLITGADDAAYRTAIINGLFAMNRTAGALWTLASEPGVAHALGQSAELGAAFFEELLPLRLSIDGDSVPWLRPLTEEQGFIGDIDSATFRPADQAAASDAPGAWLPTEGFARAWQAVLTGARLKR